MADRELSRWQARMAPLMSLAVVATAIFFAATTIIEFRTFEADLSRPRPDVMGNVWGAPQLVGATYDQQMQRTMAQATFALERELIARRYDHAGIAIRARLWTRFMGFTTGMLMALLGAAFILGRLEVAPTQLGGDGGSVGQKLSLSLSSSSPGVILAVLGTVLMSMSIVVPTTADTVDSPVYFGREAGMAGGGDLPPNIAPSPGSTPATEALLKAAPP